MKKRKIDHRRFQSKLGTRLRKVCLFTLFGTSSLFYIDQLHAQQVKVTQQQTTIDQLFTELKEQTGYSFLWDNTLLNGNKPIRIPQKNTTLNEILNEVLKNSGLEYKIKNKIVYITPISEGNSKTLVNLNQKQGFVLSGIVTDKNNRPLSSTSLVVPGTPYGAMTDTSGHFILNNVPKGATVIVSYLGYNEQSIVVNKTEDIHLTLQENNSQLDEAVVIGYGRTTKRLNTGAVSSITADIIEKQPVDNPLLAMQGRLPGVQITQDNGLPGAGVRINIRGANTTLSSGGTLPLYVIDGVPFTLFNGGTPASDNLNAYGSTGANGNISPFSLISPDDILRIDVLKDADATAIYGSRGANGVILITTKKGSVGRTTVNVNAFTGFGKVAHYIPMMNTQEYLAMRKEAYTNANLTPTATNAPDLTVWSQTQDTDWQKYFIGHTARNSNVSATVSGGDATNTFLFTTDYRDQGTVYGNDFNAKTFSNRLNAGHKSANGKFSIDASVSYTYMKTFLPNTDLSTIYNLAPNYPIYNVDSTLNWTSTNPLSYYKKTTSNSSNNLITNVNLSYKLLSNLTIKANMGYTKTQLKQTSLNPASSQNPQSSSVISTLNYADNSNENYIVEPQVEYTTHIKKGRLSALVGSTFQKNNTTGISLVGTGFASESMMNIIGNASTVRTSYNNISVYKYNAFFGRLNYDWEGKYLVNATFRRDGSSRFGSNHKFGNFGALGAAWIITQEKFMQNLTWLSFAKLRASYGLTGNDQIPEFLYTAKYQSAGSSYSYGGDATLIPSNFANPDLKWETMKKLDVGLELGFLHDRISFKTDYYRNRQSNILTYISIPSQIGTTSYMGNLNALVQNKGFEFELNTKNIIGRRFTWSTNINLTTTNNKLLNFKDYDKLFNRTAYIIGQPVNATQLYHYTGVNSQTGLPTYEDLNKDGSITYANDRYVAKYGKPYFGGITNTLTYDNFELDFTIQFVHRYGYTNPTLVTNYNPVGYSMTNQSTAELNRWTQDNTSAYYPMASASYNSAFSYLGSSDYNWGNTSFVKFKNVNISYNLPKSWVKKANISNLSVYIQGQNLYTWAKQKYVYDPETTVPGTGSGIGTGTYIALPQLRAIVFGINCSF
ncbi:SusC/RagA family TonB-linked outer membrane protein [Rhizosphaericola mali]|uniref:SusC/RagA family TonB-linked outer membrane protein n=1 Tax=Rhizosphaericola mali TaxID=2545455 RepID=UPI001786CE8E|nr:SusC/RagA family TonB-linked outer membrane protein [Rhizosphaericola mali]